MSREGSTQESEPIFGKADLVRVFENGAKPRFRYAIGIESEKVGVDLTTGHAVPFDGPNGIETILIELSARFGWEKVLDRGRVIALNRNATAITLEPGGQLELSSRPHPTLDDVAREREEHIVELCDVSTPLNIGWLNLGLQPVTPIDRIPWVPKSRYRVMREYYEKRPGLALHMMRLTASVQGNFDYESEADARRKIHVGAALGPIVGAMFANGAIEEGVLNGYCSRRLRIWRETDADRCGIPDFYVDGTFSFEKYADYVLDIPMYFILRNGEYVDYTGKTFRQFLEGKGEKEKALRRDWDLHLTTLFPDVRLKNYLELRTADAQDPLGAMALMAFWTGILYDEEALGMAFDRVGRFTREQLGAAMDDAALQGLQAGIAYEPILHVARDVVGIAVIGLSRLDRVNGRHDIRYLDPLRDLIDRGLSPAEELRKTWNGKIGRLLPSACLHEAS
ncbi:MAG TPA: glutamate-cysteine ligase family protein [Bdellovibrionota bacterium]|nr:glutamate-cysteine ligase family protein [Bdellovibrionota bacterium]